MKVNTNLLKKKIEDSGLKLVSIAAKLGITPRSLQYKILGKSKFRAAEVYVLCDLLRLTDDEKTAIFLP